jgi:hypothetical protein
VVLFSVTTAGLPMTTALSTLEPTTESAVIEVSAVMV